jgi:hypothetical protein
VRLRVQQWLRALRRSVRGQQRQRVRRELRGVRTAPELHRDWRDRHLHVQHGPSVHGGRWSLLFEHAHHLRGRLQPVPLRGVLDAVHERRLLRPCWFGAVLHQPVRRRRLVVQRQHCGHVHDGGERVPLANAADLRWRDSVVQRWLLHSRVWRAGRRNLRLGLLLQRQRHVHGRECDRVQRLWKRLRGLHKWRRLRQCLREGPLRLHWR